MSMSNAELQAELDRMKAENESLKAAAAKKVSLKVSAKGGISLYGIRKFPVTFYVEEWERILALEEQITTFGIENAADLRHGKDDPRAAEFDAAGEAAEAEFKAKAAGNGASA
jgi:hypothetical protein